MIKRLLFIFVLLIGGTNIFSQKRPLGLDDCKLWRSIDKIELSKDGRWVVFNYRSLYTKSPDTAFIYNVKTGRVIPEPGVTDFGFIAGGRFLKYKKTDKKANTTVGQPSACVLNLSTMHEIKWNPGTFVVPIGQSNYVYRVKYAADGKNALTFVNLLTDKEQTVKNAGNYTIVGDYGFLYSVTDGMKSTVYLWKNGKTTRIGDVPCYVNNIGQPDANGKGVLSCSSDPKDHYTTTTLCSYDIKKQECKKILDYSDIKGLPNGVNISSSSRLINNDSQLLIDFEPKSFARSARGANKGIDMELWVWNENLSPRRQARVSGFKPSDYDKYIYNIADKSLTVLPTKGITTLSFADASDNVYGGIGVDASPWYKESDWKLSANTDIYYIGLKGEKKKLATHGLFDMSWSPDGKYLLLYIPSSKSWNLVDMSNGDMKDLTANKISYPLYDEDSDYPFNPSAYGAAKWDMPNNRVIVYDRYDLWALDIIGRKAPVCVTNGYGRKNKVTLRLTDKDFNKSSLTYLTGFDNNTKSDGLYAWDGSNVKKIAANPKFNLNVECISGNKDVFVWRKENYGERDYWLSNILFSNARRITDTNSQVKNISWGTSQLYSWTTFEGKKNQGILFLPENYVKGKKYPMIVTYYERLTQELNDYRMPEYSSATIDIPTFVSNGYIVFAPDIHFHIGTPGESCYNTVVSGVERLVKDGIADKDHIGANGHSWGGYETAYLVTRTNIFKCASPCSAVTDMIADYLMLRGTGQPNMYFEEDSQGRLGKTLWQDRQMYIDNSPVYHADSIHTPLLIFQGDKDTSVQPYQGMALFLALRRLERPAWLLNYRNEGHQIGDEADCRDFSQRLKGFFDYYLKDKPMPEWMKPAN